MSDSTEQRDAERYDLERLESLIAEDPGAPEFPALAEAYRRAGRPDDARRVSEEGLRSAPARLAGHVSLGLALLDLESVGAARSELASILDAVLEPHRLAPEAEQAPLAAAGSEPPAASELPEVEDDGVVVSDFHPADPLVRVVGGSASPEFSAGLDDSEIEQAFEQAESQPDEMISANRMAERVLLDHAPAIEDELTADDADDELTPVDADEDDFAPSSSRMFHTQTMANLLEQQGDHEGAREIRDALHRGQAQPEPEALDLEPMDPMDSPLDPIEPEPPMDAAEVPESPAAPRDATAGRKGEVLATLESWLHNLRRGAR